MSYARTCKLYRIYDESGLLLYIGVTLYPHDRIVKHRRNQPWGADIASVEYETWPSEYAARLAEHIAIHEENPTYNKCRATQRLVKDAQIRLDRELARR